MKWSICSVPDSHKSYTACSRENRPTFNRNHFPPRSNCLHVFCKPKRKRRERESAVQKNSNNREKIFPRKTWSDQRKIQMRERQSEREQSNFCTTNNRIERKTEAKEETEEEERTKSVGWCVQLQTIRFSIGAASCVFHVVHTYYRSAHTDFCAFFAPLFFVCSLHKHERARAQTQHSSFIFIFLYFYLFG